MEEREREVEVVNVLVRRHFSVSVERWRRTTSFFSYQLPAPLNKNNKQGEVRRKEEKKRKSLMSLASVGFRRTEVLAERTAYCTSACA